MSGYALTRALARKAGRPRINVGGVDVQTFRDKATPLPSYTLTEPFAYGSASLSFPQIDAAHEVGNFGTGDLTWVREGARVVISRVFDDGSETVDYVGRVIAIDPSGRVLNTSVGGEFSGPAGMLEEQTQLFRQSIDVGRWASLAAARCGLSFSPWFGPVTGINLTHTGGQSLQSWAQFLCAMSQDVNGVQRTLMPTVWGGNTWGFDVKDYTTRHYTVFNDDARVVVDVTQDAAEAPNVIYGTGITPSGERITNSKWPGVFNSPPPDYPMAGNADFGLSTTDAATVNGDGITVLYVKLREMGYLPFQVANTGVYTSDFVAAVRKLQREVGLTVTGTMTLASWNRLFNVAYTGYSINGAHIGPLAWDPRVEEFLYTSNGSVAGRNPDYDPTILRVERTIDYGTGITKHAMRTHARGIIARSLSMKNWVGRIALNAAGGFTGDHTTDADRAALTSAAIAAYLDIRPGKNVWVPDFDGGTLFHISGVDVTDTGAVLTVDTQARDLVEVRQIRERNRDSRRDPRRDWFATNRTNQPSSKMVACDEDFGYIDRNIKLKGGQWNRFAVLGGQHGQVNKVDIRLINSPAEFVVAITSKAITEKQMFQKVGNPMTTGGQSTWETSPIMQQWLDDDVVLYAVGDGKQPCGYGTQRKLDDNGAPTAAPLTGRLLDRAPWPYIAAAHTAVLEYVFIWPDRDCTVQKGRILYPQLDDAAA